MTALSKTVLGQRLVSGIQFFERNMNFRCPKPDARDDPEMNVLRATKYRGMFNNYVRWLEC